MISTPAAAWIVARKEIAEHFRSKRIFIIGGLFFLTFLLAVVFAVLFAKDAEEFAGDNTIPFVLAIYFSVSFIGGFTFVSVLGITLSADALVGEWKDRSLFLLFSKPVTRNAVLSGKILGAYLSVVAVCLIVFTISVGLMALLIGLPGAEATGRILGGLGLVFVGVLPFVALGIFCSTWAKTPTTSFVVSLGLALLVFPLLTVFGFLIDLGQGGLMLGEEGTWSRVFTLLSPTALIKVAVNVWAGGEGSIFGGMGGYGADDYALVLSAMVGHTAFYLGLSFWILNRRDYA